MTYKYNVVNCNVPPPRGQAHLHLVAYLGHRLPSQTNTSLLCTLCPHSYAPGKTFWSVTHPQIAPGQARLTSEFFGDRLPKKKLQLVDMSILSILLSPGPGCHILTPLRDRRPRRSIPSQERPLLAMSRTSSANDPCATFMRPVPTAHPRCPRTDPPPARPHAGGICPPTRPCSCPRTYARTCP